MQGILMLTILELGKNKKSRQILPFYTFQLPQKSNSTTTNETETCIARITLDNIT